MAVIEDDPAVLDSATLVLEGHGWETHPYPTAEAFISDFEFGIEFDCLVLDPHLPGKSGAQVAQALVGSGIPILVLTARPDSGLTRAIVRLGAKLVITKPVDAAALTGTILALLPEGVPAGRSDVPS